MKDVNLPAVVTGRKNVKASPKNEPTLLVILNGYFNEIIHSINGVSSVLITGISGHHCMMVFKPLCHQHRSVIKAL